MKAMKSLTMVMVTVNALMAITRASFCCRIAVSRVSPYRPVSQVRSVGAPEHAGQLRELDILSACPHGVVP